MGRMSSPGISGLSAAFAVAVIRDLASATIWSTSPFLNHNVSRNAAFLSPLSPPASGRADAPTGVTGGGVSLLAFPSPFGTPGAPAGTIEATMTGDGVFATVDGV